jgi:hypothetical protein
VLRFRLTNSIDDLERRRPQDEELLALLPEWRADQQARRRAERERLERRWRAQENGRKGGRGRQAAAVSDEAIELAAREVLERDPDIRKGKFDVAVGAKVGLTGGAVRRRPVTVRVWESRKAHTRRRENPQTASVAEGPGLEERNQARAARTRRRVTSPRANSS